MPASQLRLVREIHPSHIRKSHTRPWIKQVWTVKVVMETKWMVIMLVHENKTNKWPLDIVVVIRSLSTSGTNNIVWLPSNVIYDNKKWVGRKKFFTYFLIKSSSPIIFRGSVGLGQPNDFWTGLHARGWEFPNVKFETWSFIWMGTRGKMESVKRRKLEKKIGDYGNRKNVRMIITPDDWLKITMSL